MFNGCKGTNKRAKYQTCLDFSEREYFRRNAKGTNKRAKYQTRLRISERECQSLRHAELISASVRGEWTVKARSEILKFAIEREQSQACLNYAERKQIERS